MSYQNKNTDEMLILSMKSIYIGYCRFVEYDSKYILDYEYSIIITLHILWVVSHPKSCYLDSTGW